MLKLPPNHAHSLAAMEVSWGACALGLGPGCPHAGRQQQPGHLACPPNLNAPVHTRCVPGPKTRHPVCCHLWAPAVPNPSFALVGHGTKCGATRCFEQNAGAPPPIGASALALKFLLCCGTKNQWGGGPALAGFLGAHTRRCPGQR